MAQGVFITQKKDGSLSYRASFSYKKKRISLGSYHTFDAAHQAYVEANTIVNNPTISIEQYEKSNYLSFLKWVCIINFRDNNLYFHTPIYLYKTYFVYYYSFDLILKFDKDDLFYYSSHKIMKRGNHLFVADYGMHINILTKYGIKNYSKLGRDFLFLNGDIYDYRYENIKILNIYYGVEKCIYKKKSCYKSTILLQHNFVIGHYKSDVEAAIAYNKAVDVVKKQGYNKNFFQNEMVDLPPSTYATIYHSIKISNKLYSIAQNNQ